MGHQIKRMQPKHYKIVELALTGMSKTQIAEKLGWSRYGISLIMQSPPFQGELARRRAEQKVKTDEAEVARRINAREILEGAATKAAERQVCLLKSEDERIVQKSAMDILDRSGYPKHMQGPVSRHLVIDVEKLQEMRELTKRILGEDLDCEPLEEDI